MRNVSVLLPLNSDQTKRWKKVAYDNNLNLTIHTDLKVELEELNQADAVFGNPPETFLRENKRLRLLSIANAGTDKYMQYREYMENVVFTNATGAFGKSISEYMLAVTLEMYKKLHIYRDNERRHIWKDMGAELSICNKNVLILGCGDIGSAYAKLMKMFGCSVTGYRRRHISTSSDVFDRIIYSEDDKYDVKKSNLENYNVEESNHKKHDIKKYATISELDNAIKEADIIALCLPKTSDTTKIMNRERIDMMKKEAMLINVGRGSLIDTDALKSACRENRILGAALDVYETEPAAEDDDIWDIDNIILTPHISGGSFNHLPDTLAKIEQILFHNYQVYAKEAAGKDDLSAYINIVDKDTGYKK